MIGILSAYDENEKQAQKEKISFVHFSSQTEKEAEIELAEPALRFANKLNLDKVYLYVNIDGKDKKIIYDYSLQS